MEAVPVVAAPHNVATFVLQDDLGPQPLDKLFQATRSSLLHLSSFIYHFMALNPWTTSSTKDSKLAQVRNEEQENTTLQSLKIRFSPQCLHEHPRMAVESFYEAGGGGEEGGSGDAGDPSKKVRGSSTLRAQLLTSRAAAAKPGTPPRSAPPLVSRSWRGWPPTADSPASQLAAQPTRPWT
jgi:hypothetical protein